MVNIVNLSNSLITHRMTLIFETMYEKLPRLPGGEKCKRHSGCDAQKLRKLCNFAESMYIAVRCRTHLP